MAGDEEMLAKAGDTFFLPKNIPHTWIQFADKGKQVYLLQPAGSFEEFLRKMQSLTKPPTEEELQKIHLETWNESLRPTSDSLRGFNRIQPGFYYYYLTIF